MNRIDISVVMPCYNSEATVRDSILSVLNQSYLPKEIIVVDDGSKDKSVEIIKDLCFSSEIPIIYLYQSNSGPSVARNYGVSVAKSDWIAFLDSDDAWVPNKLEQQLLDLCRNDKGKLFGTLRGNLNSLYDKGNCSQVMFGSLCLKCMFSTSTVLINREVFNEFKFNVDQRYSEDYRLWLLVCFKYDSFVNTSHMVYSLLNKRAFGDSGLSANLWKMEKGELSNYKYLLQSNRISFLFFFGYSFYSIARYFRRVILTFFHKSI